MTNWYKRCYASSYSIPVEYVYDVFVCTTMPDMPLKEKYLNNYFSKIKDKISGTFISLMRDQIAKYITRSDRHDHEKISILRGYPTASASQLADMFNRYTFRSERHRRNSPEDVNNVNWGQIAETVARLETLGDYKQICFSLAGQNGLFNLVHNTGTPVLDKMENGYELMQAFEDCQNSRSVSSILPKCSVFIQEVVRSSSNKIAQTFTDEENIGQMQFLPSKDWDKMHDDGVYIWQWVNGSLQTHKVKYELFSVKRGITNHYDLWPNEGIRGRFHPGLGKIVIYTHVTTRIPSQLIRELKRKFGDYPIYQTK